MKFRTGFTYRNFTCNHEVGAGGPRMLSTYLSALVNTSVCRFHAADSEVKNTFS